MRLPLALLLAQATALAAVDACAGSTGSPGPTPASWRGLALVAAAVALAGCALPRHGPCVSRRLARGLAAIGLALSLAACSAAALSEALRDARVLPHGVRIEAAIEGRVCARSARPSGGALRLCDVQTLGDDVDSRIPRRVRLEWQGRDESRVLAAARRGDRLRARVRLARPRSLANPGRRSHAHVLARRGIGARATLVHPAWVVALDPGLRIAPLERLRASASTRLGASGSGNALLRALGLGESGALAAADRERFAQLGIAHLLAVSGLHLSLVAVLAAGTAQAALVRTRAGARGDPRSLALGVACMAASLYAAMTGARIPVRRAWLLLAAVAVARWLGFRRSAGLALAWAAVLLVALDPPALFEAGAQLSFAASAAFLCARPLRPRAGRGRAARELLAASASATAATAPLLVWHGMAPSLWAPVANLLAVPWTAVVLLPLSLAAVATAVLPTGEPGELAIRLAAKVAAGTLRVVREAAAHAPVLTPPVPGWAPACVAACGAAIALSRRALSSRLAWSSLLVAAAACLPPAAHAPAPPRIVALDVGSGDATLVEGRAGRVLIDAGFAAAGGADLGRSVIVPALRALGLDHLDALALTHADADHRGGARAVLEALPVRELWLPHGPGGLAAADGGFEAELRSARRIGARIRRLGPDQRLRVGDLAFDVLWPPAGWRGSRNQRSLVLRVEFADGTSLLLPGDLDARAEAALLGSGRALASDVLHVGHHGSRGSTSPAFLRAVAPRMAIVSASCGRRGLPSAHTLSRLRAAGAALWWTGRHGAVYVGSAPLHALAARHRSACIGATDASATGGSSSRTGNQRVPAANDERALPHAQ